MRTRTFLPALAIVAILLFSGCAALGGGISQMRDDGEETSPGEPTMGQPDGESTEAPGETSDEASDTVRAGDAEVTTGAGGASARAGDVVAEPGVSGESGDDSGSAASPESAEIRLAGDEGTAFSGVCVVGGEPTTLEGEVPARLDYDLSGDGGLACEIGKEGPGLLRVALTAGGTEAIRETNAEEAKIEVVYRDGNIIASTSSSSSSSSSNSSTSVSSSSSVQNQSSSSSVDQSVSVTN